LASFLTGIARLDIRTDLQNWIFQLVLTAFSFLAVLSADLWSLLLLWTALDLIDLVFHHKIKNDKADIKNFQKTIFKFLGSMVLIWNIANLSMSGFNPLRDGLVASTANTSLFLAALLHSGIFPLSKESENRNDKESERILSSSFCVTNFVVSFSLILNLPAPELPFLISFLIGLMSNSLTILSMIRWVLKKDFEDSLKYLLFGEAGGIIYLYYSGNIQYLPYLLVLIFLSVLWLALYSHRGKNLIVFPIINIFFVSGLPISLVAFGSRGFFGNEFSISMIVLIGTQGLFLLGYLKYALMENEKFFDLDGWYQAAYLAGLFLPFLSIAAIILDSKSSLLVEIQYWWIGLLVVMLASIGYIFAVRKKIFDESPKILLESRFVWIWQGLTFEWFFKIIEFIENIFGNIFNGFSGLLEGEGGILWALVLLILMLTVLR
jgi:hypothetical protein